MLNALVIDLLLVVALLLAIKTWESGEQYFLVEKPEWERLNHLGIVFRMSEEQGERNSHQAIRDSSTFRARVCEFQELAEPAPRLSSQVKIAEIIQAIKALVYFK